MPSLRVVNALDDSLLPDVISAGRVTPEVTRRISHLSLVLQEAGCDLVLDACSSIGEAAEAVQCLLSVPILRIDLPMAEEAVQAGDTIAVVATVASTLDPTARLIERMAAKAGRKGLVIERRLCSEAFDALKSGDSDTHDRLVGEMLSELYSQKPDAIVLAQASMARIAASLSPPPVPVLSSPERAMRRVKQMLERRDERPA
jgi:glutamate racemase